MSPKKPPWSHLNIASTVASTRRYRLVGVYKLGKGPVKQFVRITVVDECCEQYQGVPPPTHSVT